MLQMSDAKVETVKLAPAAAITVAPMLAGLSPEEWMLYLSIGYMLMLILEKVARWGYRLWTISKNNARQ